MFFHGCYGPVHLFRRGEKVRWGEVIWDHNFYAASNDIILIYPQASFDFDDNKLACFDYKGFTRHDAQNKPYPIN